MPVCGVALAVFTLYLTQINIWSAEIYKGEFWLIINLYIIWGILCRLHEHLKNVQFLYILFYIVQQL